LRYCKNLSKIVTTIPPGSSDAPEDLFTVATVYGHISEASYQIAESFDIAAYGLFESNSHHSPTKVDGDGFLLERIERLESCLLASTPALYATAATNRALHTWHHMFPRLLSSSEALFPLSYLGQKSSDACNHICSPTGGLKVPLWLSVASLRKTL